MKRMIAFCLFSMTVALLAAQTKALVVMIETPGGASNIANLDKVMAEAFKTIGMEMDLQFVPPLRLNKMIDDGTAVGQLITEADFEKRHPGGVLVKVPLDKDEFFVYTKRDDIIVKDWNSLKPYTVGYMIGMLVVERNIKNLKSDGSQNPKMVFDKLIIGRTEVAIMPQSLAQLMIKQSKLTGINELKPPLLTLYFYFALSAKYKDLAPKLTSVLSEMDKKGRIKEIKEKIAPN